jgi:hypothetical protein
MEKDIQLKEYIVSNLGHNLNSREIHLLYDLIDVIPKNYSKKEILESFKFNLEFIKSNKLEQMEFGKKDLFKVKRVSPIHNLHSESVIEYQIFHNKTIVSTFGFFYTVDKNKLVTLRISNIQGYVNKTNQISKEHVLNKSREYLDKLNTELKENWRVKVVSFLNHYATKNNQHILLELPLKTGYNKSEYVRQLRQYIQTGLKAGLKIENFSTRHINDAEIKKRIENNFEIKKKRLLDSKNKKIVSKKIVKKNIIKRR